MDELAQSCPFGLAFEVGESLDSRLSCAVAGVDAERGTMCQLEAWLDGECRAFGSRNLC